MIKAEEPKKSKSTSRVLLYLRGAEDVSTIRGILAGMATEGVVCADIRDLCRHIEQEEVHAVLLTESALADGALPLLAQTLQNQPHWSDLPVLFVAGGGLESPLAVQAMQEFPNVLALDRPVRIVALTSALQMALRMRDKQRQVRDLLEERERREQTLADTNEQLSAEREELQRQSLELHQLKERAERTARAMENLARLVEENPDPAFRVGLDGRIQYRNPAAFSLGRQWNGDDPHRVPPAVQEIVSAAYAKSEVVRREVVLGDHTYLVTAAPASALAHYVNVFARDITDRKQAEEALRESEQRLALALSGTRVGMYDRDLATGEVRGTEQLARLLGLRTTTTLSQAYHYHDWAERVHPEDWPRVEAQLRRCATADTPYELEYRILWPDGSVHWLADRGIFQHDPDGRPAHLLGIAMDITARKHAEEALRKNEERLHSHMENSPLAVVEWDKDFVVTRWAGEAEKMFGWTAAETVGKPILDLNMIYPDDLPLVARTMERLTDGVSQQVVSANRNVMKTGAVRHCVWYNSVLLDASGKMSSVLSLVQDITEQKQAGEALRELNATLEGRVAQRTAELKRRTRQLQRLALEMSEAEDQERERIAQILHDDLQQELAAAKFHLSIVRSRIKHDATVREITEKLGEILKGAIAQSRSLSHELSPTVLHQDDFGQILHWLAEEMQDKHGLTVHVQGRARCESDPIKAFLYRTAQELLFNAVKHAQVGEARVRVRQCGGYLCLSVSDRGRGFDPGNLRETTGFGLLSIRERIELLGGRMKIRSAPDRGSTFFVIVPNGQITEDGRQRTADGAARTAPSPVLRVMLADDHDVVRQGLAALLSEEGTIQVVGEATNGHEAVALAAQLHPDVVVMDVLMPVMSGEEATRRIKQDLPQVRIVSLSMREEPEVRERMCEAGAESYVLKTAPYQELLAAIRGKSETACEAIL